jgi:hypothetical protein
MRGLLKSSIVCLGVSAAWACGSTSGSGPVGSAEPGAVQEFVDAFCQMLRSCCPAGGFPLEPIANCESAFAAQFELVSLVANGSVVIHSEPFAACVNALRAAGSTCTGSFGPACVGVFGGTIHEGATCEKSDQCLDTEDPAV